MGRVAMVNEVLAACRGRAEQIQDEPSVTLQVPDHSHIGIRREGLQIPGVPHELLVLRPELFGKGVIEMDARDDLHAAAVALA